MYDSYEECQASKRFVFFWQQQGPHVYPWCFETKDTFLEENKEIHQSYKLKKLSFQKIRSPNGLLKCSEHQSSKAV